MEKIGKLPLPHKTKPKTAGNLPNCSSNVIQPTQLSFLCMKDYSVYMKKYFVTIILIGFFWVLFIVSTSQVKSETNNIAICHKSFDDPNDTHTILVSANSIGAHKEHGDTMGPCLTLTPSLTPTPLPTISPLVIKSSYQVWPKIYGDYVIYQDASSGLWQINLLNINTGQDIQLSENTTQGPAAIYGNNVTWIEGNVAYAYNLQTQQKKQIPIGGCHSIYGNKVVFIDSNGINIYDFSTNQNTLVHPLSPNTAGCPSIYENKIVWSDTRNGNADIFLFDTTYGIEQQITINSLNQEYPVIYGDRIVWADRRNTSNSGNPDIYMYDLATYQESVVAISPEADAHPQIYGDKIVYQGAYNPSDILLFDISTQTTKNITNDDFGQSMANIYQDIIVWVDDRNGAPDIYIYR